MAKRAGKSAKRVDTAVVKPLHEPLRIVSLEDGKLTLCVPTQFFAEWIETHYGEEIIAGWCGVGHEMKLLVVTGG